jgi:hypothetical protein
MLCKELISLDGFVRGGISIGVDRDARRKAIFPLYFDSLVRMSGGMPFGFKGGRIPRCAVGHRLPMSAEGRERLSRGGAKRQILSTGASSRRYS